MSRVLEFRVAEVEDGRAEAGLFVGVEAGDGGEIGEGFGKGENDVTEAGVGDDEEGGETGGGGLLAAPEAEFLVEGLLGGG